MVARGRVKINNFHSRIMPPWINASKSTMQSVQSTRGQEVLPPLIIPRVCLEGKEPHNAHCCSAFVFGSFHINSFAKFASLLTLDPIRCREHEALNSMNTNIFPRRPKEVLDDSINAFSSNFVIFSPFKSNSSSQRMLDVCFFFF